MGTAYKAVLGQIQGEGHQFAWLIPASLSALHFVWNLAWNRLTTRVNVTKIIVQLQDIKCPFCGLED